MTINWTEFKKKIGNGKTKIVKRSSQKWEFVSYNEDTDEVTIIKNRNSRRLHVLPREHFIDGFEFVQELNKKPLF
jgi:hypothetical protein